MKTPIPKGFFGNLIKPMVPKWMLLILCENNDSHGLLWQTLRKHRFLKLSVDFMKTSVPKGCVGNLMYTLVSAGCLEIPRKAMVTKGCFGNNEKETVVFYLKGHQTKTKRSQTLVLKCCFVNLKKTSILKTRSSILLWVLL